MECTGGQRGVAGAARGTRYAKGEHMCARFGATISAGRGTCGKRRRGSGHDNGPINASGRSTMAIVSLALSTHGDDDDDQQTRTRVFFFNYTSQRNVTGGYVDASSSRTTTPPPPPPSLRQRVFGPFAEARKHCFVVVFFFYLNM